MKRNDVWTIALGAAQLFLFQQLFVFLSQSSSILPVGLQSLQVMSTARLVILMVAFFMLFSNLAGLVRIFSADEKKLSELVKSMLASSTLLLLLLFTLSMLRPF